MKHIFVLLLVWIFTPFCLPVHGSGNAEILSQVSIAIDNMQWRLVESLYIEALKENSSSAEHFFWTKVPGKGAECVVMGWVLGDHHKKNKEYEKAHLFFTEVLKLMPDDLDAICANAEIAVFRERPEEALELYRGVLEKHPDHLAANIFTGNYHFLKAEKKRVVIEREFKQLKSPTRMEYAHYRQNMDMLLNEEYAKAKHHLEKVVANFSSLEAKRTLEKIRVIEENFK